MTTKTAPAYDFAHVRTLSAFCNASQLKAMIQFTLDEEGEHYVAKIREYADRVQNMPKTYEQDGLGMQAIAYLHYFTGGCDWYITEKDIDTDNEGQIQAFGSANLGYGPELGYISIAELLENGVELDLHFTPKPLSAL